MLKSRLRIFGCKKDMLEYGLPADNFNFPVQFLQIDFSPLKTGKTEQFKKLKKKVKEFQLPFFIAENHCYLWLPQSRQQEYFSAFESAIPFLELPHLGIKTSRKIIYSREKKLIIENNPLIMGILNVTPDSFSDGGLYVSCNKAVEHGKQMLKAGAKIIDIGGESTRPGAGKVDENEEWNRVGETIKKLSHQLPDDSMISIDTYKSGVAEKALQNGAHIINDISGLTFDPKMAEVAAEYNAPIIMMHIKGTPENMQKNPKYEHVMDEILDFFERQINYAVKKGVKQLILDPGLGFGKRVEDNFEILRRFKEFSQFGYPVLLGLSRKSFIWRALNVKPDETDAVSMMMNTLGVLNNAQIIRVHDAALHRQMCIMLEMYKKGKA